MCLNVFEANEPSGCMKNISNEIKPKSSTLKYNCYKIKYY